MKKKKCEQLGYKQQLIMQCIWDGDGVATTQEIIDRLKLKYDMSFTRQAINASTQALLDKGYICVQEKVGNAYVFHSLISQEEFRISELDRFKNLTFDGSAGMLFQTFIKNSITRAELNEIMEMITRENG